MSDQSGPSCLQVLFEAALQDYEKQTGIVLAKHPLAEQLQDCDSVESVTAVFREQTHAFSEFRGKDKVMKLLKNTISILHKLSASADLGQAIGLHFPPVTAIQTGLSVLLSAIKGVIDSYDTVVDLLESIEYFLNRLDIYTKIPPTVALTEMVVKILVELLSTLALVTKQIKQGKPKKLFKKFLGEKDVEAVIQRLDRLTQDEARITAAQTLEIVYGLVQNMKVVMDNGKASIDCVRDALETMQQIASDINKLKRDEYEERVRNWLSPPDPWKNHNTACKSRHRGSAAWFVQGNTFSEWKASEAQNSLVWVHGKPGAGKSVLCSTIIEDIDVMRKAGFASLAFFYCDFREDQKKDLRGLLSSLLVQLCHQSDSYCDVLFKFYSEHAKGSRHPSDDALAECLKNLLDLPGLAPVYVIVDALDECPSTSAVPSPRDEVLNLIEELIKSQIPNLRICVTSRPETDIKIVLDPLNFRSISLHDESGQKRDIEDYIKSVINTNIKNRRWKAEDKQLVIDVLTKNADGMFRWVYCQVVYICGLIPARIRQALAELPETLDETYQRTLREINKAEWKFAHRLLQFIAVASRPLHVEELAELLAFDFEVGPIPKFHEGWRLEDPVDAVLSTCSSLVAIVDGGYTPGKFIQFSHFSVKEFLTSARLAEASDIILRRYHISTTPAHTLAAQACLGVLLHLDKDVVTWDSLKEFPLAKYAATHWSDHAHLEDVSRNVENGTKQLFDANKPHLAVCIWIHDPDRKQKWRSERPLPLRRTPLHYAALWGLHSIVESLVIEHPHDVHSRDFTDHATPLHLASENGHVKVVRFLLEHDGDVKAQNQDGETPLHRASQEGRLEVAAILIEHGANVTSQNKYGSTPLHLASRMGQVEVARMLIERGADMTTQEGDGSTPLHLTLQRGQEELARMLVERGADVTAQDEYGSTPLHLALQGGKVELARMLIERGADVTAQSMHGLTPLHLALLKEQAEIARMLIERGADGSAKSEIGETPLHLALKRGQAVLAVMLIERGADVTAQDEFGWTPLHMALEGVSLKLGRTITEPGIDMTAQNEDGETPLRPASQRGQVELIVMLIERGADVTAQTENGVTPLHLALQEGQVEIAGMLIERGADVTTQNKNGVTPLHLALERGQVELACMFIERGADATAQNESGFTPLHLASQEGQVGVAVILIERGADVKARSKYWSTPLHLASYNGHVEVAAILIELGADVTAQDEDGETPLHLALQTGQAKLAVMLIEHGANVTPEDKNGVTPLHLALREGQVEIAEMLIERGADVTTQEEDGETALHLALQRGKVGLACTFIERGADVTAQNENGSTPLHLASQEGQVDVSCILIERGADMAAQDENGYTPLHLASLNGQVEVAGMLIERGMDVMAQSKYGSTPLHLASYNGQVEVAGMLIERGADVTAQDEDGETPLHMVSYIGQVEAAGMLFERGADVTARGIYGLTPLQLALQKGNVELARMFIERGADVTTQDEDGLTILHLALLPNGQVGDAGARHGSDNSEQVLPQRYTVVAMVIERGANVTAQDKNGSTPLHLASLYGHLEAAGMLIEHGADVTAQDKYGLAPLHLVSQAELAGMLIERGADATAQDEGGYTPLHLASQYGQLKVAGMLIEHGVGATAQTKEGLTPLHLASQEGRLEVAGMLIEHGANVTAQGDYGRTPLHLASQRGQEEVVCMLLERGADVTAQDEGGWTPLHQVSLAFSGHRYEHDSPEQMLPQGYANVARILLERGADMKVQNKNGQTPFDLALSYMGNAGVRQVLLQYGADSGTQENTN